MDQPLHHWDESSSSHRPHIIIQVLQTFGYCRQHPGKQDGDQVLETQRETEQNLKRYENSYARYAQAKDLQELQKIKKALVPVGQPRHI